MCLFLRDIKSFCLDYPELYSVYSPVTGKTEQHLQGQGRGKHGFGLLASITLQINSHYGRSILSLRVAGAVPDRGYGIKS